MDRESLDDLFSATYEELRRLANSVRGTDPSATLNPTALVNEAYLKLAASLRIRPESRLHFKRLAARAMRQVLVEAARRRSAEKRGANGATSPSMSSSRRRWPRLRTSSPWTWRCRIWRVSAPGRPPWWSAGSLQDSTSPKPLKSLGVSEATVTRDWRAARAWLSVELRPDA
jgi:hypothetical protein